MVALGVGAISYERGTPSVYSRHLILSISDMSWHWSYLVLFGFTYQILRRKLLSWTRCDIDYIRRRDEMGSPRSEDRIGTGPPLARTQVIYVDLGCWAISVLTLVSQGWRSFRTCGLHQVAR